MRHLITITVLSTLIFVGACGSPAPAPPAPTGGGKQVDPATAGAIAGRVSFSGAPPARETIRMNADPACMQAGGANQQSESAIVAADGSVENVFVYVKDALSDYSF